MQLQGGVLTGIGTVAANVVSSGIVSPGDGIGLLTINGNYTQTSTGRLTIDLAGLVPGSGFDRLSVSGSASLAGTLGANLTNGFYPLTDASFTVLTCASRIGNFSTFEYPSSDVTMQLSYGSNSTTIELHNDAGAILANGSFETPDVPPYSIDHNPQGSSWLFNSASGIADVSGSGFSSSFPGSDDFNDGTDDGWVRYDSLGTGFWTLTNGTYRIGGGGSLRVSESYSNFYAAVDVLSWDDSRDQSFGLLTALSSLGPGTTRCYALSYRTGTADPATRKLEIVQVESDHGTTLSGTPVNLGTNGGYRMVFTGAGNVLKGQIFALPNLIVPIATITSSNPAATNGSVGVFTREEIPGGAQPPAVTFDNFLSQAYSDEFLPPGPAPDGAQVAVLRHDTLVGEFSQSITLPSAGTYKLDYKVAGRQPNGPVIGGILSYDIFLDSTLLGSDITHYSQPWTARQVSFKSNAGAHTLIFRAAGTSGEHAAFFDAITLERTEAGICSILVDGRLVLGNVLVTNSAQIEITSSFPNGVILRTLNGAYPGTGLSYDGPFTVTESATVRALSYTADYSISAESSVVTVTVVSSPQLTQQPKNAERLLGSAVRFNVAASGSAPLSYQWYHNGSPVPGATADNLTLPSVQLNDAGQFTTVIQNVYGSSTSVPATLLVYELPSIAATPPIPTRRSIIR
jgi:hypothetical protein